jgi:hypothetical protein
MTTSADAGELGRLGLYVRCVGWGVATGGATGGLAGVIIGVLGLLGGQPLGLAVLGVILGALIGVVVAVIPSVLGGVVVTGVISARHPRPAVEEAVRRDLLEVFSVIVGLLDGLFLFAVIVIGADLRYLAGALPYLAAVNVCVAVMLRWAGAQLARAWVDGGAGDFSAPSGSIRS